VAGFAFVTRGKDYRLLDHPLVQARLHLPPDQVQQRPESQMMRSLYDCPAIPVGLEATLSRVVVATHPAGKKKSPVGVTRKGVVYELFWTSLPQQAFTARDVVELYLPRGAIRAGALGRRPGDRSRPLVQPCGLGAGVLATDCPLGVESQIGTGASVGTNAPTHHRVCSCHPGAERAGCHVFHHINSCFWIGPTCHGHVLENGSLHGASFSSPA
jgi:hypothetical protein